MADPDTYVSGDKASDLVKSQRRQRNTQSRLEASELARNKWEPEFGLIYQNQDPLLPHLSVKLAGKVTYLELPDSTLQLGDEELIDHYAEFIIKKFKPLIASVIAPHITNAVAAYKNRKKLEGGVM